MGFYRYAVYMQAAGCGLWTGVLLPEKDGRFPTVIYRTPYGDPYRTMDDEAILTKFEKDAHVWAEHGYAVVYQHCRGCGRSEGDCIPYINEREDGLALQQWVREQSFYNGEIFLHGMSYLASVHYVTVPFAPDIKGAVLDVQEPCRYNANYRNGFFKVGLHGGWYIGMYKRNSMFRKNYGANSYNMLPMKDFSKTVFGEEVPDLDGILSHPDPKDDFWKTRYGGYEAHDALKHVRIPVLMTTGFYDIFEGGIFDMWRGLDDEARSLCALAVSAYDHDQHGTDAPIRFENGSLWEYCPDYPLKWFDSIRNGTVRPIEPGKVTYYRLFDNCWRTEEYADGTGIRELTPGDGEVSYTYNPYDPASFKGGLSANFGGAAFQDPPNSRYDIKSFYTEPFEESCMVKGRIRARMKVRSDCEDTCFYMRLSIEKKDGDYALRDDITSISLHDPDYVPGTVAEVSFRFDDHAFRIAKGERLRIDISSSAYPLFMRHTNRKGPYWEQTTARIAHNTILCHETKIILPIEGSE